MTQEYSETFERLSEEICSECLCSNDDCECLDYFNCPFCGEFENLLKLCAKVDSLAKEIGHSARNMSRADYEYDYMVDMAGV